jgi:predicted phosphodiesterase
MIDGVRIHVSHGHEFGSPTPAVLLKSYDADVIVFGHTHRPLVHREGSRLVVNPGAAGPRRFDIQASLALMTVQGGKVDVRIVQL